MLVMKAHEAARDAMKKACPHLKIGLTLSLHDMQPCEGGGQNDPDQISKGKSERIGFIN